MKTNANNDDTTMMILILVIIIERRITIINRIVITINICQLLDLSSIGGAQAWMYNYSRAPSQQWHEARQWCQKHFTDMVAVQNQEEAEFLNNKLPRNPNYYWIGVRKVAGEWTWVETNKNIPTEAQNWASGEPDDSVDQDCVEIYIKRERDTAKWNNENCQKQKGTLCYSGKKKLFTFFLI